MNASHGGRPSFFGRGVFEDVARGAPRRAPRRRYPGRAKGGSSVGRFMRMSTSHEPLRADEIAEGQDCRGRIGPSRSIRISLRGRDARPRPRTRGSYVEGRHPRRSTAWSAPSPSAAARTAHRPPRSPPKRRTITRSASCLDLVQMVRGSGSTVAAPALELAQDVENGPARPPGRGPTSARPGCTAPGRGAWPDRGPGAASAHPRSARIRQLALSSRCTRARDGGRWLGPSGRTNRRGRRAPKTVRVPEEARSPEAGRRYAP